MTLLPDHISAHRTAARPQAPGIHTRGRHALSVSWVVAALLTLAPALFPASARAADTVITFDDLAPNTYVHTQYHAMGVDFLPSGAVIRQVAPGVAASGDQVVDLSNCGSELCQPNINGVFTSFRRYVQVFVGDIANYPETADATLIAYDANHHVITQSAPATVVSGAGVHTALRVDSSAANIAAFTLRSNSYTVRLAIDDLSFDNQSTLPPPDFTLTYTYSAAGGSLSEGSSTIVTIAVQRSNGSSGPLQFTAGNLPDGVSASFVPNPTDAALTIMSLSAAPDAPAIDATVVVTATPSSPSSGPVPHTVQVPITITCQAASYPRGVIYDEWMRAGGPQGPIGCPLSRFVNDTGGGGGYVQFAHGQIAISPDRWEKGVVAGYQDGAGIIFDWAVSQPEPSHYNYDKFLVRWDFNGTHDDGGKNCSNQPDRDTGDQCDIMADMANDQLVLLHYYEDTHLRTKGTFNVPIDHGDGKYTIRVEGCDEPIVGTAKCRQGWIHSVDVQYTAPKLGDALLYRDLRSVPSATDVQSSQAAFAARAAAFTRYNACRLLPYTVYRNEQEYMTIILAKLQYAEFYPDDQCPGRPISNRREAIASLAQQQVGSAVGTTVSSCPGCSTGEYDVALSGYIPIIDRFGDILPSAVYEHIVNDLLNTRGRLDRSDLDFILGGPITLSETENHINMIESARYLTNDLLYARTGDPQYDNARNGDKSVPSMRTWWLKHLQRFLQTDFIEYNARPYQGYSLRAIQNLYSFAHDPAVKAAAGMVLDYVSAKLAASSNDNRRAVPYRRKAEYNSSSNLMGYRADPQSERMLALVGDLDILGQPYRGDLNSPWYPQDDAEMAIVSSYRIPAAILDLLINPGHRIFYQGLHHYADELYASSPSYLISAGGHYATRAYKAHIFGIKKGNPDDIGMALPTTVMPTGAFLDRNDLIRFNGVSDDTKRSNMCVAPNFACGIDPVVPDAMGKDLPAGCFVQDGSWTFISFAAARKPEAGCTGAAGALGFYAALYQLKHVDSKGHRSGFVEVFDTKVNPAVTFDAFRQGVVARNGGRSFSDQGRNVYVTTTGEEVTFALRPDSQILGIVNGPAPAQSSTDMATGTIMQSLGASGLITITNWYTGQQLVLDGRDASNPLESVETVTPYASDTCLPGFVWRQADPNDHVCVTSERQQQTSDENAHAQERRAPNGGPYGPDTCAQGYVWREADATDHVCVPPPSRGQAAWDNTLTPSRRAIPL